MKMPGMTMSPRPSIAKLDALRPFSTTFECEETADAIAVVITEQILWKDELNGRLERLGHGDHHVSAEHPEHVIEKQTACTRTNVIENSRYIATLPSKIHPVVTEFKCNSSTPLMANAMPNKLLAIQCFFIKYHTPMAAATPNEKMSVVENCIRHI